MIESRFGRTDRSDPWKRRAHAGPFPKPSDRDVREPGATLRGIAPQTLETGGEPLLECSGPTTGVIEDEHPHARCLAVPQDGELVHHPIRGSSSKNGHQIMHLVAGPGTEECQGNVEVARTDSPYVPGTTKRFLLPAREPVGDIAGKRKTEEKAKAVTSPHASADRHTGVVPDGAKTRRRRCKVQAVARPRIRSRSPGSSIRSASARVGLSTWRKTRPTGFPGDAPPGPTIPVTAAATSAPSAARAPGHRSCSLC